MTATFEIMKGTLAKHIHTTTTRFNAVEKRQKVKSDLLSSSLRTLQIEQSKLVCTNGKLEVTPNEKLSACETFAQQTEEKNSLIYDSGKLYRIHHTVANTF